MAPWGEMHEELKIEEVTPIPKAKECIIKLFKEMEATIVNKNLENLKTLMIFNDYVPKMLLEHNFRFLGKDGGNNHHPIRSW